MYPCAQKIDSNGNFAWTEKVRIDTLKNMPLKAFMPSLVSDGNGGCFVAWMAFPPFGQYYSCYVQHISTDGMPQWTINGVNVSDSIQFEHAPPYLIYLQQKDELFAFWNEFREYSGTNVQCAIFGQKFSNTGDRLWSTQGKMLNGWYPWLDTLTYVLGVAPASNNDFTLFFEKEYLETTTDTFLITELYAMRVDDSGNFVWINKKPVVSDALSAKLRLDFSDLVFNQWIAVWADNRNDPQHEDETGIYAQNISIDGNLGPTGINDKGKTNDNSLSNYPNPFSATTTIEYTISETGKTTISLYDIRGHFVKNIFNGTRTPGTYSIVFNSDELSPGIYFYSLKTDKHSVYNKMLIIK